MTRPSVRFGIDPASAVAKGISHPGWIYVKRRPAVGSAGLVAIAGRGARVPNLGGDRRPLANQAPAAAGVWVGVASTAGAATGGAGGDASAAGAATGVAAGAIGVGAGATPHWRP